MAANPVSAFLAGFQAVDQIETNRENRANLRQQRGFLEERMSRSRKLWLQEDDDRKRFETDRQQGDDAQIMDSITKDIMEEHGKKAEQLQRQLDSDPNNAELQKQLQAELRWSYNAAVDESGNRVGMSLVMQEMLNRLPPEARERALLYNGTDAAAGPLVTTGDPVASLTHVPGATTGKDGGGSLYAEVNVADGKVAPLTDNRTAADNDKVTEFEVNSQFMTNWLGKHWTDPKLHVNIVKFLYAGMTEAEQRSGPIGASDPSRDATVVATQAAGTSAAPDDSVLADVPDGAVTAEQAAGGEAAPGAEQPDTASEGPAPFDNSVLEGEATPGDLVPESVKSLVDFTMNNLLDGKLGSTDVAADTNPPKDKDFFEALTGNWRRFRRQGQEFAANQAEGAPALHEPQPGSMLDPANKTSTDYVNAGVPAPVVAGVRGAIGGDTTTAADRELVNQVPPPASREQMNSMASNLLAASNSRRRTPTMQEVMETASFISMDYITMDQGRRFVNTGSYDAPAKKNFHTITGTNSGITTILVDDGQSIGVAGQVRTDSPKPGKAPPTSRELVEEATKFIKTQPGFVDVEGGDGYAADTANDLFFTHTAFKDAANQAPGLIREVGMGDASELITASKAGQWQRNYQPTGIKRSISEFLRAEGVYLGFGGALNLATWVIRTPLDFINNFGASQSSNDLTIGVLAKRNGITSQLDFDHFATVYTEIYGQAADNTHVNPTQRIIDVQMMENYLTHALRGTIPTVGAGAAYQEFNKNPKGLSKRDLREEIVEKYTLREILSPAAAEAAKRSNQVAGQ
jgi:hypothetical protein